MSEKYILIADDDPGVTSSLTLLLEHHSEKVVAACTYAEALQRIKDYEISLVLLDMNFSRGATSGQEGWNLLKEIHFLNPRLPVLVLTSHVDLELAVSCMKSGARDYILKPWDNHKLMTRIKEVVISSEKHPTSSSKNYELLGKSNGITEIRVMIPRIIKSSVSILISGEKGTGKLHLAEHICEKYPDSSHHIMMDFKSELSQKQFSEASLNQPNCVILNRIDLIQESQVHLLASLISSLRHTKFISTCLDKSSLSSLPFEITSHLSLIELELPPLRERKEDLEILADAFCDYFSELYDRPNAILSPKARQRLKHHLWPGNIYELRHIIERAVILNKTSSISESLIRIGDIHSSLGIEKSATLNLAILEKEAILEALNSTGGNVTKAAKALGITRTALYRRMEKYDI